MVQTHTPNIYYLLLFAQLNYLRERASMLSLYTTLPVLLCVVCNTSENNNNNNNNNIY